MPVGHCCWTGSSQLSSDLEAVYQHLVALRKPSLDFRWLPLVSVDCLLRFSASEHRIDCCMIEGPERISQMIVRCRQQTILEIGYFLKIEAIEAHVHQGLL